MTIVADLSLWLWMKMMRRKRNRGYSESFLRALLLLRIKKMKKKNNKNYVFPFFSSLREYFFFLCKMALWSSAHSPFHLMSPSNPPHCHRNSIASTFRATHQTEVTFPPSFTCFLSMRCVSFFSSLFWLRYFSICQTLFSEGSG